MDGRERRLGTLDAQVRIRRAQRRDFAAVAELCARLGAGHLEETRHALRRFRRIVADLGNDLYLAESSGKLSGLLHLHYTRQLLEPPRAEVSLLLSDPTASPAPAGELVTFALQRARRRRCGRLVFGTQKAAGQLHDDLVRHGFQRGGEWYVCLLEPTHSQSQVEE